MGGDALVLVLRGTWAATEAAGCGLRPDVVPVTQDVDFEACGGTLRVFGQAAATRQVCGWNAAVHDTIQSRVDPRR